MPRASLRAPFVVPFKAVGSPRGKEHTTGLEPRGATRSITFVAPLSSSPPQGSPFFLRDAVIVCAASSLIFFVRSKQDECLRSYKSTGPPSTTIGLTTMTKTEPRRSNRLYWLRAWLLRSLVCRSSNSPSL